MFGASKLKMFNRASDKNAFISKYIFRLNNKNLTELKFKALQYPRKTAEFLNLIKIAEIEQFQFSFTDNYKHFQVDFRKLNIRNQMLHDEKNYGDKFDKIPFKILRRQRIKIQEYISG